MEKAWLEQLDRWHEAGEYQAVIDALEALPADRMDYECTGRLARAYNNRGGAGDCDRAVACLQRVADQGREDPLWHLRLGYALYHADREEEAAAALARALELDPGDEQARALLNSCREAIQSKRGRRQADYDPELYTVEEMEAVEEHIAAHFGPFGQVFHEIISPDIHVDICMLPPTEARPYYTLVTMGMGAHCMCVPEELRAGKLERAELVICLPPDWKVESSDETWYWPLRWLKALARLPIGEQTWLGWGHTVDHGGPFAENTALCGAILLGPSPFGREAAVCPLPGGDEVNFYQVVPLYREEMDYKMANSAEDLLGRLDGRALVVEVDRPNFCAAPAAPAKAFRLRAEEIRPVLTGWEGPEGCLATDRIVVDGCPVGFCYRGEPVPDVPDSGWHFMAGDEDGAYLEDPSHTGVYRLNTICNYDPDVLPLLNAPVGSAFARDADGVFRPLEEGE